MWDGRSEKRYEREEVMALQRRKKSWRRWR
jgi:hypothetical protein